MFFQILLLFSDSDSLTFSGSHEGCRLGLEVASQETPETESTPTTEAGDENRWITPWVGLWKIGETFKSLDPAIEGFGSHDS